MGKPVEIVNFNELPMHVTDMPVNLGFGIKSFKHLARKGIKPFKSVARTATYPARKVYDVTLPANIKRKVNALSRTAVRTAKKLGKFAIMPIVAVTLVLAQIGKAIIKKLFGGALKKLTRRRARYVAYQRRGSQTPNKTEMTESAHWAVRYAKSQGLLGKVTAAFKSHAIKMAQDPKVREEVTRSMVKRKQRRMAGDHRQFAGSDFGAEPVSSAAVTVAIPIIIALINAFLNKAAKQGAPADPRQAAPEQNLLPQIARGYVEQMPNSQGKQAAQMTMQMFNPPASNQPAQTYNFPEPEAASYDFPPAPADASEYEYSDTPEAAPSTEADYYEGF